MHNPLLAPAAVILSAVIGFVPSLHAQKAESLPALSPAAPEVVGMNGARLAEAVRLYRDAVERDDIRGAVLLVARRGRVVLHEAVGWRNFENRQPMARDTLFRMASNIKPLTAASILVLADDGKLKLTDPAAKFLPSFDNDKSRGITIAQLLSHTSGFRTDTIFYPFAEGEPRTLQVAVSKFGKVGAAVPPGAFSYSNAGYNTLGAIIEVASGQPLEAFMKSRLYDPLGMVDTLNHADSTKLDRMATAYYGRPANGNRRGRIEFIRGYTPGDPPEIPFIRASGGLISTAPDYARFLEMLRLGGVLDGVRILKEETVKTAVTSQSPWVQFNGSRQSYGYGWFIDADGTYGHTGSDGTMAWIDSAREIVGLIFTQSGGGNNPWVQFRRILADAAK